MRTAANKGIRCTSPAEVLSALTKSLAFQVQMIMWEDRKSRETGTQGLTACTRIKKSGSLA